MTDRDASDLAERVFATLTREEALDRLAGVFQVRPFELGDPDRLKVLDWCRESANNIAGWVTLDIEYAERQNAFDPRVMMALARLFDTTTDVVEARMRAAFEEAERG